MDRKELGILLACILVCLLPGVVGSGFTYEAIPNWYAGLEKPFFTPPNWLFAPVWSMLYVLMGVSLYFIVRQYWEIRTHPKHVVKLVKWYWFVLRRWTTEGTSRDTTIRLAERGLVLFAFQLVLNGVWSIVFFGMKEVGLALLIIWVLGGVIGWLIHLFWKINRKASLLLIPYLIWVSYATGLNWAIWLLN